MPGRGRRDLDTALRGLGVGPTGAALIVYALARDQISERDEAMRPVPQPTTA